MKDKEFDRLFKDQLEDALLEPSAHLWNNIAKELKPRKKRTFSSYWMAAAVTLIVLSAGLLAPKEEKIRLRGTVSVVSDKPISDQTAQVTLNKDSKIKEVGDTDKYESTPLIVPPHLKEVHSGEELVVKQSKKTISLVPIVNYVDTVTVKNTGENVYDDVVLAKVDAPGDKNSDVIAESDTPGKGIQNMGDLFNYVISKVDKREDKFLKFNTDDDNSSLVGINIGFIKLNLKRNK